MLTSLSSPYSKFTTIATAMATSRIVTLAQTILADVFEVDESLRTAQLPELSLSYCSPEQPSVPPEDGQSQMAKNFAIGAATEMLALLNGPVASIKALL